MLHSVTRTEIPRVSQCNSVSHFPPWLTHPQQSFPPIEGSGRFDLLTFKMFSALPTASIPSSWEVLNCSTFIPLLNVSDGLRFKYNCVCINLCHSVFHSTFRFACQAFLHSRHNCRILAHFYQREHDSLAGSPCFYFGLRFGERESGAEAERHRNAAGAKRPSASRRRKHADHSVPCDAARDERAFCETKRAWA